MRGGELKSISALAFFQKMDTSLYRISEKAKKAKALFYPDIGLVVFSAVTPAQMQRLVRINARCVEKITKPKTQKKK
jgi:hypothetical protein